MKLYKVRVEATYGADVKVGDRVTKGQKLGTASDFKTPVASPVDGVVKEISFDADDHTFVINIEES
ncbi:MAG: biotin/lipoyl-containing protein [Anaerolineae bacterium]